MQVEMKAIPLQASSPNPVNITDKSTTNLPDVNMSGREVVYASQRSNLLLNNYRCNKQNKRGI
jgi:hypothetical protein